MRRSVLLALVLLAACRTAPRTPSAARQAIVVDGHPISVLAKRPAAPTATILLIHGRTWSGAPDFDLQVQGERLSLMDRLAQAGFVVYAQDLRGYGETPRDSTGWATPDRAAKDVAAILTWIADSSGVSGAPALLGWSYGSMVSMLVAQRNPDLISGLILYGFPIDTDEEIPPGNDDAKPAREPTTQEAARSDFITPGSISQQAVETFVREALAADPVRTDWRRIDQFNALDPARVVVPTQFLHGARDPLVNAEAAGRLFSRLATADRQWTVIPGTDHAAHLERPGVFADVVVGWLTRR